MTNHRRQPLPVSRVRRRPALRRVLACGLVLSGGALAGCEAIGAMAYKMSSNPEIPAAYTPAKKPTLVLVEKSDNPGEVPLEAEQIARQISAQLREHDVAPLVDSSPLAELRSRHPERYRALTPAAAARLTGAAQVLYVDLVEFNVADAIATELAGGRVAARVRLLDAGGETLWPMDTTQGLPISVDDPYARTGVHQTPVVLRQKMCQGLSDKIARLFFKYRSDQVDGTEPRGELTH